MTTHVKGKHHRGMASASSSTRSVSSFFRPQVSQSTIQAEALWSNFVVDDVIEIMSLWVWLLGVVRVWLFVLEIQFRKLAPMDKEHQHLPLLVSRLDSAVKCCSSEVLKLSFQRSCSVKGLARRD